MSRNQKYHTSIVPGIANAVAVIGNSDYDLSFALKNFKLSYVDLLLLSADGLDDLKYAWQGIEKCAELIRKEDRNLSAC